MSHHHIDLVLAHAHQRHEQLRREAAASRLRAQLRAQRRRERHR